MTAGHPAREPTRIGGYRILSPLGQGGMGEVFLAWDERLHRHVALKRLRSDLPLDEHQRARFRREARAAARLSHPAVVQIYDILEAEDGDCIVMERLDRVSLAEALARGEVDLDRALHLGAEIAGALAEAHGRGIVHRDLKPENVLVTPSGHAKDLDFGNARLAAEALERLSTAPAQDSGPPAATPEGSRPAAVATPPPAEVADLPTGEWPAPAAGEESAVHTAVRTLVVVEVTGRWWSSPPRSVWR